MKVQVNTDHTIQGDDKLLAHIRGVVESALSHISQHVTRVEVHLTDENGARSGQDDKRCMMEARLEGHHPIAVTHEAKTLGQAVEGAADKLSRLVESTLGRLRELKSRRNDPPFAEPKPPGKS